MKLSFVTLERDWIEVSREQQFLVHREQVCTIPSKEIIELISRVVAGMNMLAPQDVQYATYKKHQDRHPAPYLHPSHAFNYDYASHPSIDSCYVTKSENIFIEVPKVAKCCTKGNRENSDD